MEGEKDHLSGLDAAIGDGDMGVSIASGFRAVRAALEDGAPDIGRMLQQAGLAFSDAAGATIGALFSIALLRAAKLATGKAEIGSADLLAMGRAAEDGIRERGKARSEEP